MFRNGVEDTWDYASEKIRRSIDNNGLKRKLFTTCIEFYTRDINLWLSPDNWLNINRDI